MKLTFEPTPLTAYGKANEKYGDSDELRAPSWRSAAEDVAARYFRQLSALARVEFGSDLAKLEAVFALRYTIKVCGPTVMNTSLRFAGRNSKRRQGWCY
jgi:hypothetical protein